jgi:hypothetical protein
MRADMAKVLVERPRHSSREGAKPGKGYRKRVARMMADGGTPVFERMTARYNWTRSFNEHLGPLRRYVQSQVGRPWNKVYSEICARVDRGNVVQKHILTHLFDYVVTDVILIDGVPCAGPSTAWREYGTPLHSLQWFRGICYVCPKSGLLRRVPCKRIVKRPRKPSPPAYVRVNEWLQCRHIDGRWELVTLAPLPSGHGGVFCMARDVILDAKASEIAPSQARKKYGAEVYATSRRVLGKREQMQYPIPIEFISR